MILFRTRAREHLDEMPRVFCVSASESGRDLLNKCATYVAVFAIKQWTFGPISGILYIV